MISTIFDRFGPAIISTHEYGEVEGWLPKRDSSRRGVCPYPLPGSRRGRPIPRGAAQAESAIAHQEP